jgi:hypothetical protein
MTYEMTELMQLAFTLAIFTAVFLIIYQFVVKIEDRKKETPRITPMAYEIWVDLSAYFLIKNHWHNMSEKEAKALIAEYMELSEIEPMDPAYAWDTDTAIEIARNISQELGEVI